MEIWKDIKGYEGVYQISNIGRVKSLARTVRYSNGATHTVQEKIKSTRKNPDGYLRTSLSSHSNKINYSIHRLVAEHFIDNNQNLEQVNHIDGNKENNAVTNLEWCTSAGNMKHAHRTGLIHYSNGEKHQWSKLTEKDVIKIMELVKDKTLTQKQIGEMFGISHSVISRIKNGTRWGRFTKNGGECHA